MKLNKSQIVAAGIILLSFLISAWFWPQMPERMATHWGISGQVNGYMPKFWGLFFVPILLALLGLLFWVFPRLDPLKANIAQFRKYYDGFIVAVLLFMIIVHIQVILWNRGLRIPPNLILPLGVGILFYYIGIISEKSKRNWWIGIRTPWTLSSDRVWERTHRLGAKLFKIAGGIIALGLFFPKYSFYFIIIPALGLVAFAYAYSYAEYRKETQ